MIMELTVAYDEEIWFATTRWDSCSDIMRTPPEPQPSRVQRMMPFIVKMHSSSVTVLEKRWYVAGTLKSKSLDVLY